MRRHMVITTLAMALTLGATAVASAQSQTQDPRRGAAGQAEGRRGGPGGMLLRGITLTADQKTRVEAITKREHEQRQAERGKNQGQARQRGDTTGFGARRAEMMQHRDQRIAELRSILNGDQRVQFDKNVAEMKTRMAQGGGHKRGDRS